MFMFDLKRLMVNVAFTNENARERIFSCWSQGDNHDELALCNPIPH